MNRLGRSGEDGSQTDDGGERQQQAKLGHQVSDLRPPEPGRTFLSACAEKLITYIISSWCKQVKEGDDRGHSRAAALQAHRERPPLPHLGPGGALLASGAETQDGPDSTHGSLPVRAQRSLTWRAASGGPPLLQPDHPASAAAAGARDLVSTNTWTRSEGDQEEMESEQTGVDVTSLRTQERERAFQATIQAKK